jgi:hypothetical protein
MRIDAKSIGYDNFPIYQNFVTEGTGRKTCTLSMLRDWIESSHHLVIETTYDDTLMWGYMLRWSDGYGIKTLKGEFTYIDTNYQFKTEELAFDAGLGRAIEEIHRINEEKFEIF